MTPPRPQGHAAQTLAMALLRATPSEGLRDLIESGWMERNLPELLAQAGLAQPPAYHAHDALRHTLATVDAAAVLDAAAPDLEARLTALLHDIAKPTTAAMKEGRPTFYGHDTAGAAMVPGILERLGFLGGEGIALMVGVHMRSMGYHPQWSDKAVRSLRSHVGDRWPALMNLTRADLQGTGLPQDLARIDALEERGNRVVAATSIAPAALGVSGADVMEALHLRGGPQVGSVLRNIARASREGKVGPDRDAQLRYLTANAAQLLATPAGPRAL